MASSLKPKKIYDVFLSFRGMDLRNNFLDNLYKALVQNGIYTFLDSENLRKGDQISPVLMKAIEESCIGIILFSEDYASSQWCLEEVAKIMECEEQKHLSALPVFYKVEPIEVRGGRESYGRALAKHESKFGKDSEKVKRWKKALFDASSLSGWHLNNGDESELIQGIMKEIFTRLDRTPLDIAKHPVGIDSRVVKLKSMLNLEFDDGVLMVGLWGPGGIGKTCLAKAVYNAIFRQFEGSCFLANVRETSKGSGGLVTLQEILLKDVLLLQQRLEVSDVHAGISIIQHRLSCKKVLLILDDIDDLCQLNALAGQGKWFGNESRIIVTTRDKHLLTCHEIDHVYEVEALDDSQAHELLSKHAIQTHQIRTDLVGRALNYCDGLPLALEVLGSLLCGAIENEWESTIMKLSQIPDNAIISVLKLSYDGLDGNEKEIFLHIACFFKGRTKEYTKKVLDSCDLETTIGFEILMKRSMIRIENNFLEMHDLIQSMGMDIANQECRYDPRRRTKLWLYDDVVDVLSHDTGDCAVKAIVLEQPEPTEMWIGLDAFTNMRRLRLLILGNVQFFFQGPICLPNDLRWFEWLGCPHSIPEFSSGPKRLVGLDMSKNNITGVLKQLKDFQNMKYISFNECESLVSMPDLSCTPNLEELNLHNCKNLVEAHNSIAYHDKLEKLALSGCSLLSVFPNVLKSKNLRSLVLRDCMKLERFPNIPQKLRLEELVLRGTAIKELPTSIENLVSLESMDVGDCKNLVSLPSSIYKLQSLEKLTLEGCTKLIGFPKYEDLADPEMKTGLSNLRYLNLRECNLSKVEFLENLSCFPLLNHLIIAENKITSLPTSINKRDSLTRLEVMDCHQLREIPELPSFLDFFSAINCESLQKIGEFTSSHDYVRRGLTMDQVFSRDQRPSEFTVFLPGEEMPKWVIPVGEGFVSFMASKDLYDKFLGFALCVAVRKDEKEQGGLIEVDAYVNSKRHPVCNQGFGLLHSDHIWFRYMTPSKLWGVVDFGQIEGSYVQLRLVVLSKTLKKWGFCILCKQLKDDLEDMLQDNQSFDPTFLYEVSHDSINSEAEISLVHTKIDPQKGLEDCLMSTEKHGQIVLNRNRNHILARGMQTKTMLSSNSIGGDENGGVGLQLLLLE